MIIYECDGCKMRFGYTLKEFNLPKLDQNCEDDLFYIDMLKVHLCSHCAEQMAANVACFIGDTKTYEAWKAENRGRTT